MRGVDINEICFRNFFGLDNVFLIFPLALIFGHVQKFVARFSLFTDFCNTVRCSLSNTSKQFRISTQLSNDAPTNCYASAFSAMNAREVLMKN